MLLIALTLGAATTAVAGDKQAPPPGTQSALPPEVWRSGEARERPLQVITFFCCGQRAQLELTRQPPPVALVSFPNWPMTPATPPSAIIRIAEARERPVERVPVAISLDGPPPPDLRERINEVLW
jgi:hypothetical protein